jgi:hypothetical protein
MDETSAAKTQGKGQLVPPPRLPPTAVGALAVPPPSPHQPGVQRPAPRPLTYRLLKPFMQLGLALLHAVKAVLREGAV